MKRKNLMWLILLVVLIVGLIFFLPKLGAKNEEEDGPVGEEVLDRDEDGEEELSESEDQGPSIGVGKEAPDFSLNNLSGDEISLEDYRGKIVLLNFWGSWCSFCDRGMPSLQKASEENEDLVVLAVNVMEDKEVVEKYIEKGGYDFQVVLDEKGHITETYLAQYLPTSYFIDGKGVLVGGKVGMLTDGEIRDTLNAIRQKAK